MSKLIMFATFFWAVLPVPLPAQQEKRDDDTVLQMDVKVEMLSLDQYQLHIRGKARVPDQTVIAVSYWSRPYDLQKNLPEPVLHAFAASPQLIQSLRVVVAKGIFETKLTVARPAPRLAQYGIEASIDLRDQHHEAVRQALGRKSLPIRKLSLIFFGVSADVPRQLSKQVPELSNVFSEAQSWLSRLKATLGPDRLMPAEADAERLKLLEKTEPMGQQTMFSSTLFSIRQWLSQITTMDPHVGNAPNARPGDLPVPVGSGDAGGKKFDREQPVEDKVPQSADTADGLTSPQFPLAVTLDALEKQWAEVSLTWNVECYLLVRQELRRCAGSGLALSELSGRVRDSKLWQAALKEGLAEVELLKQVHQQLVKHRGLAGYADFWKGQDPMSLMDQMAEYFKLAERRLSNTLSATEQKRLEQLSSILQKFLQL